MNKSLLILKMEYLKRIKKRSFIIMTILMPLLFAASIAIPFWLTEKGNTSHKKIAVYDGSDLILGELKSTSAISFKFVPRNIYDSLRNTLKQSDYDALLAIPPNLLSGNRVLLYSSRVIPIELKKEIRRQLNTIIERDKKQRIIDNYHIEGLREKLASTKTAIDLQTIELNSEGTAHKSSTEVAMIISYITAFAIYLYVLIYGAMVMRGVSEEKSNRIVEILVSSVKPRQLMFGKIAGIGLVGLTQLFLWFILGIITIVIFSIFHHVPEVINPAQNIMSSTGNPLTTTIATQSADTGSIAPYLSVLSTINFTLIISAFILYFLLGFLLYASLMGAIGAAIDQEEDAQQLTFPVFIPLIFAIILVAPVIMNPDSTLAIWTSMIPLTSPIVMMARLPLGVPTWQLILSILILIGSTILAILIAAKIYRTGLLMYGKKVTIKEITKWIFYH